MKKTWQEKMADKPNLPKVLKLEKKFPCYRGVAKMGVKVGDTVVITQPKEVDEVMSKVPKGTLITINEICKKLAKKHKVKACCSLTCGIFINIVANAVEEMKAEGKKNNSHWWRTIKPDGSLNEKFPQAPQLQKKLLQKEGFKITQKGKKYKVVDFEKYLTRI